MGHSDRDKAWPGARHHRCRCLPSSAPGAVVVMIGCDRLGIVTKLLGRNSQVARRRSRPALETVEWPGRQLLHHKPPWPDANRLAHEIIREQTRQSGTDRDGETAKLLLRPTRGDVSYAARGHGEVESLVAGQLRAGGGRSAHRPARSARSTRRFTGGCCPFAARGPSDRLLTQQAGPSDPA
jgi:hypothetical protein